MPLLDREELPESPGPYLKHEMGCLFKLLILSCLGGGVIATIMGGGLNNVLTTIDLSHKSQPNRSNNMQNNNQEAQTDYGLGSANDGGGFWTTPDSSGCKPLEYLMNKPECQR